MTGLPVFVRLRRLHHVMLLLATIVLAEGIAATVGKAELVRLA